MVTWSPPVSGGAGPITSYTVTSSGGQQATVPAAATTALVSGLAPGAMYSFTVTATNQFGTSLASAPSNSVTVLGAPAAPMAVRAVPGNAQAALTWVAPNSNGSPITEYVVTPFVGGVQQPSLPTGGSSTSFIVPGLVNGIAYTFTVTAQNVYGVGPASSPSNAAVPDVIPGAPGAPVASGGNGQVTLFWTPPTPNGGSSIQQYIVAAYPGNGAPALTAATHSAAPTYAFTGLHNGVSYTFTVSAENRAGAGPASQPSAAVTPSGAIASGTTGSINGFQYGELEVQTAGQTGCGSNSDFEPQVAVSPSGTVLVAAERGLGGGSDVWRAPNGAGGSSATACGLTYVGQPNAVSGVGASGGDIAIAVGTAPTSSGTYPVYVASLNGGSISVASSTDDGQTYVHVPVQAGLPDDDRPWIAAEGSSTSLLSYHDRTGNIDVLRSDNGGASYVEVAQPIPATDYRATTNEIGNLVIDHRTTTGVSTAPGGLPGFWAYQGFVAPSSSNLTTKNELFTAVSADGGLTWRLQPVGCSTSAYGLDHIFPALSVSPTGTLWAAWSDDTNVYTATSSDHGATWVCSGAVSTGVHQAIEPTLVATSAGVDLAYYATPTLDNTWSVYFVQNVAGSITGWGTPIQLNTVHSGLVCEAGAGCNGQNRQLFEDFGIDVDASGWAHIAYSHDGPNAGCSTDLGCQGSYTGYLEQTSGVQVGYRN